MQVTQALSLKKRKKEESGPKETNDKKKRQSRADFIEVFPQPRKPDPEDGDVEPFYTEGRRLLTPPFYKVRLPTAMSCCPSCGNDAVARFNCQDSYYNDKYTYWY